MLGDNVYGDDHSGELTKLKFSYEKQKDNFSMIDLELCAVEPLLSFVPEISPSLSLIHI